MGLFKKKKDLPLIQRVNLSELQKQREEDFANSTGGEIIEEQIPEGWTAVKVGDNVSALCHTCGKIVIEDKEK